MNYAEAAAWLDAYSNIEQRLDPRQWAGIKLERVERLVELLGHPERHGHVVHLAGSKGKGSTAAIMASILAAAGWRVGLYTSPHLVSPRERIRIDGAPITEEAIARLITDRLRLAAERYQTDPSEGPLTYFDLHTALAFIAFQDAGVDWSVIEVGLGGRLDATNVVLPEVSIICSLGLEHTSLLGDTLDKIAFEKAGIIKPGVPVITAPQDPAAADVLQRVAAERGARLLAADLAICDGPAVVDDEPWGQPVLIEGQRVLLPLLGLHQVENASLAVAAAQLIAEGVGQGHPTPAEVREGLASVRWPGRLDPIERRPWLVLDGAHTPASAVRLAEALRLFPHQRRYLVLGSALDKDFAGLATALCEGADGVIVTGIPDNQRAASGERLLATVQPLCQRVAATAFPAEALALARSWAGPDDLICGSGSLYLVGALYRDLRGEEPVAW